MTIGRIDLFSSFELIIGIIFPWVFHLVTLGVIAESLFNKNRICNKQQCELAEVKQMHDN